MPRKKTSRFPSSQTFRIRNDGLVLLGVVAHHLSVSRRKAKKALDERRVLINGHRIWMAGHRLEIGDEILILPPSASRPLKVLYQDDDLVVIDKPSGLISTGAHSAEEEARRLLGKTGICAVHRLDKDTTGCLILATRARVRENMIPLFKDNRITKVYHALVAGAINERAWSINQPLERQRARTKLLVLSSNPRASHVQVLLETGRTHQIRKHLASAHHPVLGDKTITKNPKYPETVYLASRQMLHAASVQFPHPFTHKSLNIRAPLPPDFRDCMRTLKLK